MNTYDIIDAFKKAMSEAGVTPPVETIIGDGQWHRYHIAGHKQGSQNGAYKLYLDGIPNGLFTDHKTSKDDKNPKISGKWKSGAGHKPFTQADRLQCDATKKRNEQQIAQSHERAAIKARHLLAIAKPITGNDHPYLQRKRVESHGLYRLGCWTKHRKNVAGQWEDINVRNVILVPLIDLYGTVWNVQAIFEEAHPRLEKRDKDFLRGGLTKGVFHAIGQATNDEVLICEGYATGASLHEATGFQVLCAMTADNLLSVAQAVRAADPKKKIVLAADNDDTKPGNTGVTAAKKAARAVGGFLAIPPVSGDFNDYANQGGQL